MDEGQLHATEAVTEFNAGSRTRFAFKHKLAFVKDVLSRLHEEVTWRCNSLSGFVSCTIVPNCHTQIVAVVIWRLVSSEHLRKSKACYILKLVLLLAPEVFER
mmetsp:Transcript_19307/g.33853  ORF Transcript_19307/g.33853 Transcript_19307/m.33853 type:complete len:103 (-) Transcript_19307:725-1033(-)